MLVSHFTLISSYRTYQTILCGDLHQSITVLNDAIQK